MRVDRAEHHDQYENEEEDDPGAVCKLGAGNDDGCNAGRDGAYAVHKQLLSPMRPLLDQPSAHHAGLGKREGDEHADCVQRDQGVRVAVKEEQEDTGEDP